MANPEIVALLTADAVALDPVGKVTLYGIFDVIHASQFPTRHPQLAFYCKCRFSAAGTARIELRAPDGTVIHSVEPPVSVEQAGIGQAVYVVTGFEFPVEGIYSVALVSDDGDVGSTTLELRVRQ